MMLEIIGVYLGFGFLQWLWLAHHPEMLKPSNAFVIIFLWPLAWASVIRSKK